MKLFIDDERFPVEESWVIVRSSQEAIEWVTKNGLPEFISFDHDLGGEDTSMIFVHWFINYMLDNKIKDEVPFFVHSQNPIGKRNIEGLLLSFYSTL